LTHITRDSLEDVSNTRIDRLPNIVLLLIFVAGCQVSSRYDVGGVMKGYVNESPSWTSYGSSAVDSAWSWDSDLDLPIHREPWILHTDFSLSPHDPKFIPKLSMFKRPLDLHDIISPSTSTSVH
jgi:hypothetical protein